MVIQANTHRATTHTHMHTYIHTETYRGSYTYGQQAGIQAYHHPGTHTYAYHTYRHTGTHTHIYILAYIQAGGQPFSHTGTYLEAVTHIHKQAGRQPGRQVGRLGGHISIQPGIHTYDVTCTWEGTQWQIQGHTQSAIIRHIYRDRGIRPVPTFIHI